MDLKKVFNLGDLANEESNIWKILHDQDFSSSGLKISNYNVDEMLKFYSYLWSEIYNYNLNRGLNSKYQTYNSNRAISEYLLAKYFGVEYLITKTEYVTIDVEGLKMVGILTEEAAGVPFNKIALLDRSHLVSPQLQIQMNTLQLLDVISYEKDHRPDNYNLIMNGSKCEGVCAFDNDSPLSFWCTKNISFNTYVGCTASIKAGVVTLICIDKCFANKLVSYKKTEINELLSGYLTKYQLLCLNQRIIKDLFVVFI